MAIEYLRNLSRKQVAIAILLILYVVGIIGVSLPLHPDFMMLTPVNLSVSFLLAVWADENKHRSLFSALALCYFFGLLIELIGVQTGNLFGAYSYGATLGPKIAGTPLIIGLNWAMLVYATVSIANHCLGKHGNILLKSIMGATLMVALDVLIEPVAVRYDFWSWENTPYNSLLVAPLQNYQVWWFSAFILHLIFHKIAPNTKNRVVEVLFYLQAFFFLWIFLVL